MKGIRVPRKNPERQVAYEANLARRIQREREKLQLSYERLARRMGELGCPIQPSSIYRIEQGKPPRRITVDELGVLAEIFDLPVGDLLDPPEVVDDRRAKELVGLLQTNQRNLGILTNDIFNVMVDLLDIGHERPELYEYAMGHFLASPRGKQESTDWVDADQGGGYPEDLVTSVVLLRASKAGNDFQQALVKAAKLFRAARDGELETASDRERLEREYAKLRKSLGVKEGN